MMNAVLVYRVRVVACGWVASCQAVASKRRFTAVVGMTRAGTPPLSLLLSSRCALRMSASLALFGLDLLLRNRGVAASRMICGERRADAAPLGGGWPSVMREGKGRFGPADGVLCRTRT